MGKLLGQIFGDQTDAETRRGFAMQPYGGARGFKRFHVLSEKTRDHAGQHIAASGSGEPWRRVAVHRGAAIGRSDDRIGTLEHDDASREVARRAGPHPIASTH